MGFDVTQDATNFYVELTNITYSGRVVAYNPRSVEIYRSLWPIMVPTIRTVVTIPKPVDEGTYCFFFYDLNDVAHSGWNKCVQKTITPSRYRCTSNGCVADPAGVYSDLAACQAGCASAGVVATTITAWPQDSEPGDSVIIKPTYKNNTAQTLLSDLKIFFDGKLIKTESGKSFSAYATYELTYIYYLPFDTVPGNHTITATATGQTTNIPTFTYRSAGTPSRYSCTNGMCTADPNGIYTSLSACQSACQSQYHNVCQNGTCVRMTGVGANECPTIGASCTPPPPPSGLFINDLQGSVSVPLNTPVKLRVQGIGANKDIMIQNISATPDVTIVQGTTNSNGVFETTVTFSQNGSFELRGYYNCISLVCANETNTVNVTAGKGSSEWLTAAFYLGVLGIGAYIYSTYKKGRGIV